MQSKVKDFPLEQALSRRCQFSPVEILMRAKKEIPKDSKLTVGSKGSYCLISANKLMLRIENMYRKSMRSPPTFTMAGKADTRVLKITLSLFALFINLKILKILKALMIVAVAPTLKVEN